MSRAEPGPEGCRPFDRRANGTVLGRRARRFWFWSRRTPRSRAGRAIYAELAGAAWGNLRAPAHGFPAAARRDPVIVRRALAAAGVTADAVDVAYLTGAGHPAHDACELDLVARALPGGGARLTALTPAGRRARGPRRAPGRGGGARRRGLRRGAAPRPRRADPPGPPLRDRPSATRAERPAGDGAGPRARPRRDPRRARASRRRPRGDRQPPHDRRALGRRPGVRRGVDARAGRRAASRPLPRDRRGRRLDGRKRRGRGAGGRRRGAAARAARGQGRGPPDGLPRRASPRRDGRRHPRRGWPARPRGPAAPARGAPRATPDALSWAIGSAPRQAIRSRALRRLAIRAADRTLGSILPTPLSDSQCGFRIYPGAFLREITLVRGWLRARDRGAGPGDGGGVPAGLGSDPVRLPPGPPEPIPRRDGRGPDRRGTWRASRLSGRTAGRSAPASVAPSARVAEEV